LGCDLEIFLAKQLNENVNRFHHHALFINSDDSYFVIIIIKKVDKGWVRLESRCENIEGKVVLMAKIMGFPGRFEEME
jgi:hypothetical protein